MTYTYIEPFDFRTILINYFLGSNSLFAFAFLLIFSYISARYGLSNLIYMILLAICSAILAAWIGQILYFLILFITGFILYKAFARVVS